MRSDSQDIVELFGFAPDDTSATAVDYFDKNVCPFNGTRCTKIDHISNVLGVCTMTDARARNYQPVITCPQRLYANQYQTFENIIAEVWPDEKLPLVVGGDHETLAKKARKFPNSVVAFGQRSGAEIAIKAKGDLSMDWVLQRYRNNEGELTPIDFVGIEVQSIDTTGNYRDNLAAYRSLKGGKRVNSIPKSEHGLNWANVHKRLLSQIIRKGALYRKITRCRGFYFIVPDAVFQHFESALGSLPNLESPRCDRVSVHTYSLGIDDTEGKINTLQLSRRLHLGLDTVVRALDVSPPNVAVELDRKISEALRE